jgi:hypothetical protein
MSKYVLTGSAGYRGREEFTYNLKATDLAAAISEAHQCIVEVVGGEDSEYNESDPEEGLSDVNNVRIVEIVTEHKVDLEDPALYQVYTDRINELDAIREERTRAYDLRQLEQLKAKLGVK